MRDPSRVIADILRVNHAGECAAIRIYRAQLWAARSRAPDLPPALKGILAHEISHRDAFADLMRTRRITPCGALGLWGLGGTALGLATGLMGRQAILICTTAVERTVHRHLDDQLHWLGEADPGVSAGIARIQAEELEHLTWAETTGEATGVGILDGLICFATDLLIWLSTYGASARMAKTVMR